MNKPERFVFMKVGAHAGEGFDAIMERKSREYRRAGRIFWGYGGPVCHPVHQVRPFVEEAARGGERVSILMQPIVSNADPDILPATEYSEDGINWKPIPDGILVTGSRYAIVTGEIEPVDFDLPLDDYLVGIGKSEGRPASEYIKGRVDKACLRKSEFDSVAPTKIVPVRFAAEILDPYAVLLRGR